MGEDSNRVKHGVGAWRLAGMEIRSSWPSYVLSAAISALFGVLIAGPLNAPGGELSNSEAFTMAVLFVAFTSVLAANWASGAYVRAYSDDPFTKRTAFLRTLPIPARTVALGKALAFLPSLAANSVAFFVPPYALFFTGADGWLVDRLDLAGYLCFAGFWLGYAILWGGFYVYFELCVGGRLYTWISFAGVFVIFAVISFLEFGVQARIVEWLVGTAATSGIALAGSSLLVGTAGCVVVMAARRLRKREFLS